MKQSSLFHIENLIDHAASNSTQLSNGRWVPARPLGWSSPLKRLRYAWMVFTGKADAVLWEDQ